DREDARKTAAASGADFLFIECRCPDEEIERRLALRMAGGTPDPSDGRGEIFRDQKINYEKVAGFPPETYLQLDTDQAEEACLEHVFRHLLWRSGKQLANQGKRTEEAE
ncbi:MAG TPA: hypothetical protein VLS90_08145, partial [Thermodesulfobacteriota bacterium]|nr:hypothetical protein [Thermodesulfobacteriota bacterium]